MGCVKNGDIYRCENGPYCPIACLFCEFGTEGCKHYSRGTCLHDAARAWADDKAKIEEQAQRIQDLGDDLDNANELLTIAEEKAKEQAATIGRLRACLREADQRLDDVLRTLKSESHTDQILDACDVIEAALGEKTC